MHASGRLVRSCRNYARTLSQHALCTFVKRPNIIVSMAGEERKYRRGEPGGRRHKREVHHAPVGGHSLPSLKQHHQPEHKQEQAEEVDEPRASVATHLSDKKFTDIPLSTGSIDALTKILKFDHMTKVQAATCPIILEGKDLVAKAKTGTGKTVGFVLPSIEALVARKSQISDMDISVLIISPTRELTVQITKETETLLKFHAPLSVMAMYGGTNINSERKRLQHTRADILVATPGRLIDHLENSPILLKRLNIQVLVLDEADQLLEMGFRSSIETIIKFLPKNRQTLLFSATMPKEVQQVTGLALKKEHVFVDTVEQEEETHTHVDQFYTLVPMQDNWAVVYATLKTAIKEQDDAKIIVFSTTARLTQHMAAFLGALFKNKIDVIEIHSRKSQSARDKASIAFRNSRSAILCTSDVSARGVDYPNVTLVLQLGMPSSKEQYVHRLGRTARAGKNGKGHIILSPFEAGFVNRDLRDLPLQKWDAPVLSAEDVQKSNISLSQIDGQLSGMAYQTWLGYYNSCKGAFRNKAELVEQANLFAKSMGLNEPPMLMKKTVGKMGLKGVPGLNIEGNTGMQGQSHRPRSEHRESGPTKRFHSASRGGRGNHSSRPRKST
eukprot:jgi/Picsp_1/6622/NSC_03965-R1_dead-box atp-dependent rna helicase 31-like